MVSRVGLYERTTMMEQSSSQPAGTAASPGWLTRHRHKVVALVFWLVVIGAYWWYTRQHQLSPWAVIQQTMDWFVASAHGPLFFIIVFTFQPLVLFPSALMGVAAGYLYGPLLGIVYTIVGANGAALVMYGAGRFFGHGVLDQPQHGRLYRYAQWLRQNTFEAILVMHLIFLPYDAVNYFAGFLRVNARAFVAATVLGALPGIVTFVLFGASIEHAAEDQIVGATPQINPLTLIASGVMLVISLLLSRAVRRRARRVRQSESVR